MASKRVTLSIPHHLYDALVEFAPHAGYKDEKQLLIWSAFYSVLVGKYHHVTAPIANASSDVQDIFINDFLDAKARGDMKKGSYLEAILGDLLEALKLPLSKEILSSVLKDAMTKRKDKRRPGKAKE